MDRDRVRILAGADASGAAVWGVRWLTPIVGGFGGLWHSFLATHHACKWCPPLSMAKAYITSNGRSAFISQLNLNEDLITQTSNINPYNNIGFEHNRLVVDFGTQNPVLFDDSTLSIDVVNYIDSYYSGVLSVGQISNLIAILNNDLSHLINLDNVYSLDSVDINDYIAVSPDLSLYIASGIYLINEYIVDNDLDFVNIVNYLSGIEELISEDTELSASDKAIYYTYCAVYKYSYALWLTAEDL